MNKDLLYPMAFYIFHIWCLLLFNFRARLNAIKKKSINVNYFKDYRGDIPEQLVVIGRHFDNQFQVPMIFFITCLVYLVLSLVDQEAIIFAWLFVASRVVHSFIHLTSNNIVWRLRAYATGLFMIFLMWVHILVSA